MPEGLTCEDVMTRLEPFMDSETDVLTSASIERHIAGCANCREALEQMRHLSDTIRLNATYYRAPNDLSKSIPAQGVAASSSNSPLLRRYRAVLPLAGVVLLAAGLVIGIFIGEAGHRRDEFAESLVAGHERALASGHVVDVVSEDRHTVKPWFLGKLDFAPSVPDLSANGFPLLGGRLDYLGGHRAAVLVYGKGKHVIDLYVMPVNELESLPANSRGNGIGLLGWDAGGLRYCAVSDVTDQDLQTFKALVQAQH